MDLRPLSNVRDPHSAAGQIMTRCYLCGDHRAYADCVQDLWKYNADAGLAFNGYVCRQCQVTMPPLVDSACPTGGFIDAGRRSS